MSVAVRHEHPIGDRPLAPAHRSFREETGYVTIPKPRRRKDLDEVIDTNWEFLMVNRDDPETWHQAPLSRAGTYESGLTE